MGLSAVIEHIIFVMVVEAAVVVVHVLISGKSKLLFVGQAGGAAGVFADTLEDGEKYRCENRDNCDNDEQLNQSKGAKSRSAGFGGHSGLVF